jgi:acetolactate synthase-1/2/3 large subunit
MATCGELLAKMLEAYGIDTAFGIPGTHTIELYRGLPQTQIRHVTPRHEQGAGFMADGYARVTGRPAACITVSGPGALNIATSMGQALVDSVPMLVISADNARHELGLGEGRLHEVSNLQQAASQWSRWCHTVMRPDELPRILARAFAIFSSERPGPVHLIFPQDVITSNADHVDPRVWSLPSRPAAAPDALAQAAALIAAAGRPVIALGGGAAGAANSVLALAERIDAPTTLTQNAKGILPPGHPLCVTGSPSFQPVRDLYLNADLIIGIGTEFAETDYDFLFDGNFSLGETPLVRIDIDAAQLTRNTPATIAILADAGHALESLLPLCRQQQLSGAERTAAVNSALRKLDHPDYQAFLDCVQTALPDVVVIGDSTQPIYFAAGQYHPAKPRSFANSATGFGTLGYGLPAAFGAKLGRPERPVVCLIGDGGLQFSINELSTAVEAGIAVAVVVWNNHGYEMIAQNFRSAGMAPIACDIHTPDFIAIAAGYGCPGERPNNLEQLRDALVRAQQSKMPTLIEVMEKDFLH